MTTSNIVARGSAGRHTDSFSIMQCTEKSEYDSVLSPDGNRARLPLSYSIDRQSFQALSIGRVLATIALYFMTLSESFSSYFFLPISHLLSFFPPHLEYGDGVKGHIGTV
jgi:hypothetical protein